MCEIYSVGLLYSLGESPILGDLNFLLHRLPGVWVAGKQSELTEERGEPGTERRRKRGILLSGCTLSSILTLQRLRSYSSLFLALSFSLLSSSICKTYMECQGQGGSINLYIGSLRTGIQAQKSPLLHICKELQCSLGSAGRLVMIQYR